MRNSAKTGSRRRLLGSPRARGDRPSIRRPFAIPRRPFSVLSSLEPQASSLQNLIANARLEFRVTRTKQSTATKSNRERIAILQSGFSGLVTRHPSLVTLFRSRPIATDDPTRIGILSDQRRSKELSSDPAKILRTAEAPATFLIATFANSKFESTHCKHATKQNSNSNKTAISGISAPASLHPCLPASFASLSPCRPASLHPSMVAATRRARYNSGSHIEVNQP
jgi:hypothetical protein